MESKKKKRYKWTYLQNRNRLTENEIIAGVGGTVREGLVREFVIDMYTQLYLK